MCVLVTVLYVVLNLPGHFWSGVTWKNVPSLKNMSCNFMLKEGQVYLTRVICYKVTLCS